MPLDEAVEASVFSSGAQCYNIFLTSDPFRFPAHDWFVVSKELSHALVVAVCRFLQGTYFLGLQEELI